MQNFIICAANLEGLDNDPCHDGTTFLILGTLATTFALVLWFRDMTTEGTFLGDHTLIVQKALTMGRCLHM